MSAMSSSARKRASSAPCSSRAAAMRPVARVSSAVRTWSRTASLSAGLTSARITGELRRRSGLHSIPRSSSCGSVATCVGVPSASAAR